MCILLYAPESVSVLSGVSLTMFKLTLSKITVYWIIRAFSPCSSMLQFDDPSTHWAEEHSSCISILGHRLDKLPCSTTTLDFPISMADSGLSCLVVKAETIFPVPA